jgi:hypothetical protein
MSWKETATPVSIGTWQAFFTNVDQALCSLNKCSLLYNCMEDVSKDVVLNQKFS